MTRPLLLFALASALAAQSPGGAINPPGPTGSPGSTGAAGLSNVPAGQLVGANLNVTTDQAIPITIPAGYTKYTVQSITVYGASATPTLAVGGVYTAPSKGGSAVIAATQAYSTLTTTALFSQLTLATIATTTVRSETTLYLSLTTAAGVTCTANVVVNVLFLP